MVRTGGELHETVVKALTLLNSSDWSFVKESDGVRFSDKAVPWCDKKAIFFETSASADLDKVISFLSQPGDMDSKERNIFKYDELLESYDVLKKVDEDTQIVHTCYKSPFFGVSARDVVTLSHECMLTAEQAAAYGFGCDDKVFIQASFSQSDAAPAKKGYVRGESHVFAILAVQRAGVTGSCDLKLMLSFDPSGMIPSKVVDLSASNQMKKLIHIRTHTEKK